MRDASTPTRVPQFERPQPPSDLEYIASLIDGANERLSAVRNYVCLFVDLTSSAADSSKSMQLDATAMGDVLLDFMAQLEDSIEALSTARSIAEILDEQAQEIGE